MKVIGFCGWSGSGKTDLICRVIKYLSSQKLIISTIKHTHHNIEIDKKGKDSYSHRKSGAREVLVGGNNNWSLIHTGDVSEKFSLHDLTKKFSDNTDILIVEGFKNESIDKIEVYNSKLKKNLISKNDKNILALVYDKIDQNIIESRLPKFNFKDTNKIANFILDYIYKNEKK
tara:strand:- start:908 stop:1426 length:519 start_codon:yes stop_codon:yes gene_type:complete